MHGLALGHRVRRVVGALAVHVGLEQPEQAVNIRVGEQHDVVHVFDRRHHFRAIGAAQNRAARSLQSLHRLIVVDGDDQPVGLRRGAGQIAHMADVHHVEAPVGKRNRPSAFPIGDHGRRKTRLR